MSRRKSPIEENSLGGRIEALLADRKMSRVDLAEKIEFKASYLSEVIRGLKSPSEKFIKLVAQQFNVNGQWLRTGEGAMQAEPKPELTGFFAGIATEEDQRALLDTAEILKFGGKIAKAFKEHISHFKDAIETKQENIDLKTQVSRHSREIDELKREVAKLLKAQGQEWQDPPGNAKEI